MRTIENTIKIFLAIILLYVFCHYFFIFKDVVLSIGARRNLTGKIVYSTDSLKIKVIELPSGEKKTLYTARKIPGRYLESVNSPYFSPSGRKITFIKKVYADNPDTYKLYVMDSDGANVKKILDLGDLSILSPSWSPDGSKIAFVVKKEESQGIYIVDVYNPSDYKRISNIKPSGHQPGWSFDSQNISFISSEYISRQLGPGIRSKSFVGKIFIIDIKGNVLNILSTASEVALSPEGDKLVYEGKDGYYLMTNISSRNKYDSKIVIPFKSLLFDRNLSYPIRWSPDGKYIVFCKDIWFGFTGIYVAPIDNPKKHIRIATEGTDIVGMSWVR